MTKTWKIIVLQHSYSFDLNMIFAVTSKRIEEDNILHDFDRYLATIFSLYYIFRISVYFG